MIPLVLLALFTRPASAVEFVWPLSNSTVPNLMNTSFGPRCNYSMYDFHDGIDLPAPEGATCYAVCDATVFRAGPAGTDNYSSRHVVLRHVAADGSTLFVNYMHLSAIDPSATTLNAAVTQGQTIGYVGHDDATYDHCHFEIRRGSNFESSSRHPLHWMPYTDSANFSFSSPAPSATRFNRSGALLAGRVTFGAGSKEEGDLKRVEVDLRNGGAVLSTRAVEFDDKTTVQEGPGDEFAFTGDIAVEGYQSSNMVLDGRTDLSYGVLVRDLPVACDNLLVRVMDLAGHTVTGAAVPVPASQTAFDESATFDSGVVPPPGWLAFTSTTGTWTTVSTDSGAAHDGARGLTCADTSNGDFALQQAAVGIALPPGRFEWTGEGWFNPLSLGLAPSATNAVYLLEFTGTGGGPSVAALIYNAAGTLRATLAAVQPDGSFAGTTSYAVVTTGVWRHWRLGLVRLGTRETTAVLSLDQAEVARMSWVSSTFYEPVAFRGGIGLISPNATAVIRCDGLHVTEAHNPPFPSAAPPLPPYATPFGDSLADAVTDRNAYGPADPACMTIVRLPPDATVEIVTPSGHRVRKTLDRPAAGQARWCFDDDDGRPVARGVYLAVIRSGGSRRFLKLVLRR